MPRVTSSELQLDRDFRGTARDSTLVVTMDPGRPLVVGTYVFQLVVTDRSGRESRPMEFTLVIV